MHHPGTQGNGSVVVSVMNTMKDNGIDLSPKRGGRRHSLTHQSSLTSTSHSSDSTSFPKLQRRNSLSSTNGSAHVTPRNRRNSLNGTAHSCDSTSFPKLQRRNSLSSTNESSHVTPRNRRNSLNTTTHSCNCTSMPKLQRRNSMSSMNGSAHVTGSPRHRRNSLNATTHSCDSIPIATPKGRRNSISDMSHTYHSPTGKMSKGQRRNSINGSLDAGASTPTPRRNSMSGLNPPLDSTFYVSEGSKRRNAMSSSEHEVAESPDSLLSSPKKESTHRHISISKSDSNRFLQSPKPTTGKVTRSKEPRLVQKIEPDMHSPTKQRRRLSNNGPVEPKDQLKDKNLLDSPRRRTKTPSRRRSSEVSSPRKVPVDKSLCAPSPRRSKDTTEDSSRRRTKTPSRRQRSEEKDEKREGESGSPRHPLRSPVRRRRDVVKPSDPDSLLKFPSLLVSPTKGRRKSLVVMMEAKSPRKLDQKKTITPRSGLKKSLSMTALNLPALDLPVVPRGVPILPAAEPKIEPLKQKDTQEATGQQKSIKLSANRRDSPRRRRMRREDDDMPPADFSGESPKITDTKAPASPRRSLVRAFSCEDLPLGESPSNEFQSSTMRRRHETKPLPEWKRRLQSEPSSKEQSAPRELGVVETPTSPRRFVSHRGSARQSLAQLSLLTDKLASPTKSSRPTFSRQPSSMRRARTPDGRRSSNARRRDEPSGGVVEDFWMFGKS